MRTSNYAGIALLFASGAALAQQPLTLPGRSQSTWQQSIDNAACYAYANQHTHVDIARQPRLAPRDKQLEVRPISAPRAVAPPLPPLMAGASGASATVAAGASTPLGASASAPASGAALAMGASAPVAASGPLSVSASGASDATIKMPPLPPPEAPMAVYWRSYGECMQDRGYFVR